MGTFSVYVRLGSVPSLFFDSFFPKHLSFILLDRNLEIVINRKMKLLFQLAMTFLALVCLAIAIPANHGHNGHHGHHGRMKDSVVEPMKEQDLLRMAIPANHGHHGHHGHHGRMKDSVVEPKKEQNLLRMAIPANHGHNGHHGHHGRMKDSVVEP